MVVFTIIVLFILFFFCNFLQESQKNKVYCILSAICLILISGLRNIQIGSDTENYLTTFKDTKYIAWHDLFSNFFTSYLGSDYVTRDPGFIFFEKFVGIFIDNNQLYLILIATICIVPISVLIYSNTRNVKASLMAFIYYVFFYFSYIPNSSIRQSLALSLLLVSLSTIKRNKLVRCIAIIFIASTIHKSALIFLLLVIFNKLKWNKILFKYGIFVFLLILTFYQFMTPYVSIFGGVYSSYGTSDFFIGKEKSYAFIIFLTLIYFMTLLPVLMGLEKEFEKYKMAYLSSSLALFFTPLMLIDPTILRITVYFAVYNFTLIPHSIQLYKPALSKSIYITLIIIFLFAAMRTIGDYNFYWEQ